MDYTASPLLIELHEAASISSQQSAVQNADFDLFTFYDQNFLFRVQVLNGMYILMQVQPLLRHARWETRAAAGECLSLMAAQAQHPTVAQLQEAAAKLEQIPTAAGSDAQPTQQVKLEAQGNEAGPAEDCLCLESLSMEQVLQNGTPLLASGGQVGFFQSIIPCDCSWELYDM